MINTLIFDFGDVFINLDKPAIERSLFKLGVPAITEDMLEVAMQYERGLISTEKFVSSFTTKYPAITAQQFKKAWNSIILDFPEYRLEFIEKLSTTKNYTLILLSNTNALHIEQVITNMTLDRYERFKNCFDQFYVSHELQLRKPDVSIYKYVLEANQLEAVSCFFVDDTKENTEAASQLGIHTWNNDPVKEDVIRLFENPLFTNAPQPC
ncbi:MAG: Alpha-D-glucose 1-phosphate phosphatase YihX [Formosa sp. Hel1_33_131]|jgi:putative hydrolase of the HAD superfamily|nr:MAG: Alpha-D-glucose 1-phosphate phosphatase YihX [Formosa sp. Hel1_33_131]|tara:strand:+ start:5814 stop:6443 length:630 start_codon:yes stop_codon:yes gene_type:complete